METNKNEPLPPKSDPISDIKARLFKLEHDVNNLVRLTQSMYEQLQALDMKAAPVVNKIGTKGPILTPEPDSTLGVQIEKAKTNLKNLKLII